MIDYLRDQEKPTKELEEMKGIAPSREQSIEGTT
jgi:hypothetical protein